MIFTSAWLKAAGTRALHTVAQTALGMITMGATLYEINWLQILSVSVVAGIISLLKSIVAGTPEATTDGTVTISDNIDNTAYEFDIKNVDIAKLKDGNIIRLGVIDNN